MAASIAGSIAGVATAPLSPRCCFSRLAIVGLNRLVFGTTILFLPADAAAGHGTMTVSVIDVDTGRPVYGRVMFNGPFADDAIIAAGQKPFKVGDGLAWVVPERLSLTVPAGEIRVTVERGTEYEAVTQTFTLEKGEHVEREFRMKRWVHMAARGWFSGETHIHFPPDEVRDQIRAEDLNVGTTIASWVSAADHAEESPSIDHIRVIDEHTTYSINDMEIERFPIHLYEAPMYLVNLRRQVHLNAPTPAWPLNLEYARRARAEGGIVCAHSAAWDDVAVTVAFGEMDAIGLANNFFGYAYSYTRTSRYGNADDLEEFGDSPEGTYRMVLGKYYKLLNCGFRLPVSAGTAAGVKPNPTGFNRAYVRLDVPLTYSAYMNGFKTGRSFATNGPMIFLDVQGVGPGEELRILDGDTRIEVTVTVFSAQPLARLNLVHNGRAINVVDLKHVASGEEWTWTGTIELDDHSGWLAAHVESAQELIRFAHTSPIWIEHPKRWVSERDAAYFSKWIRHRITELPRDSGFLEEAHREEVAQALLKAAEVYDRLIDDPQPPR